MNLENQKEELIKQKKILKQRQKIISFLIKKWTDNEIKDFLNINQNLSIQTEIEIKNHILDKNMHLFNNDEILTLSKSKNK